MTKLPIHRAHLADYSAGNRGIGLLGIVINVMLFFGRSICAAGPVKELKSLEALSFEASGRAPEILRAIYSAFNEEGEPKINLQNNAPMVDYARIHGHLLENGNYRKIRSLDLSNLGIDDLPAFIFNHMTNLESLNLSGNPNLDLSSEVFKNLCQKLVVLDVSGCNIDEDVFDIICNNCHQLETLILPNSPNISLNSEAFESLCQQLVVLDVSGCNVDKSDFSIICSSCTKLKILRVSNNPRIKLAGNSLVKFKDTLEELRIDNCDLDAADMEQIREFKSLERLDISNNWLKEFFEKLDLGDLKNTLTELRASKVGMTLQNLHKITECPEIRVLDISRNNLRKYGTCTDILRNIASYALSSFFRIDVFLGNLADRLTSLNVSRANLSTDQLRDILDSPSIETLDCSCNDFSGLDDTFEIGRAKGVLKDAKFSNCYIESPDFLEEILDCSFLTKLDISRNGFGMLYDDFVFGSSANSLKWLDISRSEINVRFFAEILGKSEIIEYLDISGESLTTSLRGLDHAPIEFDPSKVVSTVGGLRASLRTLKASNCNIQNDYHLLYSFTDCENLEHLDISENNLSQFPTNFQFGSSRETLKCLNMNNCGYISLNTLRAATDLEVLEVLNMDNNRYRIQERFDLGASKNSLKVISMSGSSDSFNSSILQAISECKVLETLDLSKSYMNRFELEDFDFGSARSSLRKISMKSCGISSEVLLKAVFDCEKLQELDLSNNYLSNLSEDFKLGDSKHSLKVLNMNKCYLRGQNILFEITDCSNLKELYLYDNDFENIFGDFSFGSSRHSLKVLNMNLCKMENEFAAISSCEALEKLYIACNSFSSYNFGTSKNTLKDLNIFGNSFSGIEDFNQIFTCKRLEKLDVSCIPLDQLEQELNPEKFSKSALKELTAHRCELARPSSLEILTSFPKLEKINISENLFGSFSEGFSLGVSKDTLSTITAENCNFSDKHIIKAFTDCKRLEALKLCRNERFKGCDAITFGASTNSLKELDLERCHIDLSFWMDEIRKCTKIQKLNLLDNDIGRVTSEFDYDGFRNSIGSLWIDCFEEKNRKILSILAKYYRLEYLVILRNDLRGLNHNFKFGNLTYTLKHFYLVSPESEGSYDKHLRSFKFLEGQ